mgnify:FL=1
MRLNKKILQDLAKFIQMRYDIDITKHNEKHPELFKSFMRLQYWLDEIVLERYFGPNDNPEQEGTYWIQQLKWETRKSGQKLLDYIGTLQDEAPEIPMKILDVGCGTNEWKPKLGGRLLGIDPYHPAADIKIGINEFASLKEHSNKYDIVLALGSINFGDQKEIEKQIVNVVKLTKPGGKIFWRCNPGITHDNKHAQWVDFFKWSEEYIYSIAEKVNCKVNEVSWDHPENDLDIRWGNRLYSEWTKQAFNS